MSETERAREWARTGEVGVSSATICNHFARGIVPTSYLHEMNWPWDPDDYNRCRKLLEAIPEWRARIGEMAAYGPEWAALVARWDEIERTFEEERQQMNRTGVFRAPRTYDLMSGILADVRAGR